jgi:hypothetical protein
MLCGILGSCQERENVPTGSYEVNVLNKEGISGRLEIVGEPQDYFGRIVFEGKRKRTFPIGLSFKSEDSLAFLLAGGGYLRMKKNAEKWKGNFKYFGLEFELEAFRIGEASEELEKLVSLKPLARGFISTNEDETFPCYDAASQTMYFTRNGKIFESTESAAGSWSEPEMLSFFQESNNSAPYLFNKGRSMFFTSNKKLPNSEKTKKNLWMVNKDADGNWLEPTALPNPVNIDSLGEYHAAISKQGNLFFVSYNRKGGFGRSDLYKATPEGSGYIVENLGAIINTQNSEADAFIHPNEK